MESKIDYHVLSMDEIVFDNRNKAYGAFAVRRVYEKNLIKAILISIGIFGLSMSAPGILKSLGLIAEKHAAIMEETIFTLEDLHPYTMGVPKVIDIPKPAPGPATISQTMVPVLATEVPTDTKTIIQDPEVSTTGTGNPSGDNSTGINSGTITGSGGEDKGKTTPNAPYTRVEQMPAFIGGDGAFDDFVEEHLIYPEEEREEGIEGITTIQFVIDENGLIKDAIVSTSSGYSNLDKEALRLVKSLPKYKPGKQNGVAVRVLCVMPIGFGIK